MKRILLMVFRNILLVPYMWIKLCHRAAHPENYTLEEHVKFLKWIVFRANKGGNVKIEEHGAENLPKENGFMFFPNHQGMYDVLAILVSISIFCSSQKRSEGCSVFKAGLFLHACIYDRPGRYQAVYAGDH